MTIPHKDNGEEIIDLLKLKNSFAKEKFQIVLRFNLSSYGPNSSIPKQLQKLDLGNAKIPAIESS